MILLSAYTDFLELPDLARFDELLHERDDGVITVAMRDGEPHALVGAKLHDLIGFGQSPDEGFLDIDALHTGFDGGDDHVPMLMDMSRADGRDIRLNLSQHDLIVGVGFHAPELLGFGRQSLGVGIRDGDDAGGWDLQPDGILAMPVVALTGMTDDAHGQRTSSPLGPQQGRRQGQGRSGEEIAAFHVTWWSEGS